MPPKKKETEEKQVLIGRMGTNLKCGIVGEYGYLSEHSTCYLFCIPGVLYIWPPCQI
jgi:hypothetical protein